jgi:HEAT repeat protein
VLQGLFTDPYEETRDETVSILGQRENRDQTQRYLLLAKDPDWRVCASALSVLCGLNPDAIPVKPVSRLLKASDPEAQEAALHILGRLKRDVVSRPDLLTVLSGPRVANIRTAINLIENLKGRERDMPPALMPGPQVEERERWLTSSEATVLVTNRFTEARLIGLGVLRRNADAKAIELILKSLRDPNPVVREKAFSVIKLVTNQNISDDDAAKWESWWHARKTTPAKRATVSPKASTQAKGV